MRMITRSYKGLTTTDRQNVEEILTVFRKAVVDLCTPRGLSQGQIPFGRPSNSIVVLDVQSIHIVVDDMPISGMPQHTYIDQRQIGKPIQFNALIEEAKREYGFQHPIGTSLPASILEGNRAEKKQQLQPMAGKVCIELLDKAKIELLDLPPGFQHFKRFFPQFLHDYPDNNRNVFLMMRFNKGEQYEQIQKTLRREMDKYEFTILRADNKDYTGDLWDNVCLYMLGSKYGVAVFEEIDKREFNPNIALELGFMLALNKRCLILKDKRMPKMPTDIIGKLYKEFDTYDIESTITLCVKEWIHDIGLS